LFAPAAANQFIAILFYAALAEFLFYRVGEIAGQAFQAIEQLKNTAFLLTGVSCFRFLAACGFSLFSNDYAVLIWSQWYLAANVAVGILSFIVVSRVLGWPSFSWGKAKLFLGEGFFFSFGIASKSIYTDSDKILLARMAQLDAAGHYAAAYSVVSFAFTPVQALLAASYPHFFKAGAQGGVNEAYSLSKRLLLVALPYGMLAAVVLYWGAPLLPFILGERFSGTVEIIQWLAIVPCVQVIHYLLADALTGAGMQRLRSMGQVATAVFNICLNLCLIPFFSWKGAAIATLLSELGLTLFLICAIVRIRR
jgi:O-antigen/teichoic acid export membrane protein